MKTKKSKHPIRFKKSADYFQKCRIKARLSQRDVAQKFGFHLQLVSNWERGECLPPGYVLNGLLKMKVISRKAIEIMAEEYKQVYIKKFRQEMGL